MSTEAKEPVLERLEEDPWDVGQITERLPAWEQWEDGVEPVEVEKPAIERAA